MAPASQTDLKVASILYFQLYEKDLPKQEYTNQDIQYIIKQLEQSRNTNVDYFTSELVH